MLENIVMHYIPCHSKQFAKDEKKYINYNTYQNYSNLINDITKHKCLVKNYGTCEKGDACGFLQKMYFFDEIDKMIVCKTQSHQKLHQEYCQGQILFEFI